MPAHHSNHTEHIRGGMSFLEITIAVALFMVVMASVFETQVAGVAYAARAEGQDELTTESTRVLDVIAADIASSGWWFSDRAADYKSAGTDRTMRYLPFVQMQDTGGTNTADALGAAFPHTWRDRADPRSHPVLPLALDDYLPGTVTDRTSLMSAALAATATERTAWYESYYARSQEPIFLKASISAWNHVEDVMLNTMDGEAVLFFSGTRNDWKQVSASDAAEEAKRARLRILYASGWKPLVDGSGNVSGYEPRKIYTYRSDPVNGTALDAATQGDADNIPYGVVMESGILMDPNGDLGNIQVNWITIDGKAYTTAAMDANNLREFTYAVVRSPVGLGRLVRAHKIEDSAASAGFGVEVGQLLPRDSSATGSYYMRVDKVLSDNVVRIVFDTFRTVDAGSTDVSTLDYNTVRARIYFARVPNGGQPQDVQYRVVDRVFTMRAQNSARDKDPQETDSNASILGSEPIGLRF